MKVVFSNDYELIVESCIEDATNSECLVIRHSDDETAVSQIKENIHGVCDVIKLLDNNDELIKEFNGYVYCVSISRDFMSTLNDEYIIYNTIRLSRI